MGMTLAQLAAEKQNEYKDEIILANVNGKLKELGEEYIPDSDVTFVTTSTSIGNETYRRSVVLLMLAAIEKIDRNIDRVVVEYSLSKGLYCTFDGDFRPDKEFIDEVKSVMHSMVEKDLPIKKELMKISDAMNLFKEKGMTDKTSLFKYRRSSFVNVYDLNGYKDYFYGYMVASTGYLKYFDLKLYQDGFMLLYPNQDSRKVAEFVPSDQLFHTLDESSRWGDLMGIGTIGALDDAIASGRSQEIILIQEALMEKKIGQLAQMIKDNGDRKFVMIAGPSSSGKTTFSHRLSIQLSALGLKPHPFPLDDYYLDHEYTPLDENGQPNYECLEALDVERFNQDMNELLTGREVEIPVYNFKTGKRETKGKMMQLGKDDLLVIEGIHGLNDKLSYSIPKEKKFKIYISALTQLDIDEHNNLSTTDVRLIRRIVRDARTRGSSAASTIGMWNSVRRGEEKYIFPFQEEADVMFNSALIYEMSVLKQYVEPLLFGIEQNTPEYLEANRLLKVLDYFLPIPADVIGSNSIIREFIGGSCFHV